ncbi:MAG: hypothetical protein JRJ59_13715, partial [Deltaproteobacteria bacterium]|nr:hypothetical protein [Deltaproteobacteria bacterium]
SPADLEGSWDVYFYGGYDTFTESATGSVTITGELTSGSGYYRGLATSFTGGTLLIAESGNVAGTLRCEQVEWFILRAWMNQCKTEITGMANGSRAPVIMRLIKTSGEPAEDPDVPQE